MGEYTALSAVLGALSVVLGALSLSLCGAGSIHSVVLDILVLFLLLLLLLYLR